MKVAFIGLGNMGTQIAQCVLRAGFDLTVWNRTAAKMRPLMEAGARGAATAREAASGADVVLTSLMDDKSIVEVVKAADGILSGLRPGAVHVCLMTISPRCAEELERLHREHGSHYVSGPVVGRPDSAASGTLISYLAGPDAAIEQARPVCSAYSKQVVAVSQQPGVANSLKLCINYSVVSIIELLGEAYTLAEKCGVNREVLRDFYLVAFAHPALKTYANKLQTRDFDGPAGFSMKGGLKDVRLMLATAEQAGAPLEIGRITERKLQEAIAAGMQDRDWSAFSEVTRREAGLV
jgi:3-hydroxyisobutyrate dehydrogenase-like beta-hydroxyacid dehydrogenase